jgi:hypothetical protein
MLQCNSGLQVASERVIFECISNLTQLVLARDDTTWLRMCVVQALSGLQTAVGVFAALLTNLSWTQKWCVLRQCAADGGTALLWLRNVVLRCMCF